MTVRRFQGLLRFSGAFNIIFASPLILPWAYQWYLNVVSTVNQALGLGGLPISIADDPAHVLLIHTAGIDLVLIGSIVLYAAFDPRSRMPLVLLNASGRITFFLIIVYYVLAGNLARIFLVFGVIDLCISIGFLYYWRRLSRDVVAKGHNARTRGIAP